MNPIAIVGSALRFQFHHKIYKKTSTVVCCDSRLYWMDWPQCHQARYAHTSIEKCATPGSDMKNEKEENIR